MRGGDHSYPGAQLTAWNVTKEKIYQRYYLPGTYLKLLLTSMLPVGQLRSTAR